MFLLAHRVVLRQRSISVAFEDKEALSRIYERPALQARLEQNGATD